MSTLINASIDISKISPTKIIEINGKKFLNITINLKDEKNQFDQDVSIWETASKEEREAKAARNYIGNGKTVFIGRPKGNE